MCNILSCRTPPSFVPSCNKNFDTLQINIEDQKKGERCMNWRSHNILLGWVARLFGVTSTKGICMHAEFGHSTLIELQLFYKKILKLFFISHLPNNDCTASTQLDIDANSKTMCAWLCLDMISRLSPMCGSTENSIIYRSYLHLLAHWLLLYGHLYLGLK